MEKTRIIKRFFNGQWTVMDSSFLKSLTGTARTCGTREKFTHCSVTGVTVHLYGWGWVEDVSQNIHAYCVRAVRIIVFNFILHPPPPMCRTEVLHNDVRNWCVQIITDKLQIIYHKQQIISRNYG